MKEGEWAWLLLQVEDRGGIRGKRVPQKKKIRKKKRKKKERKKKRCGLGLSTKWTRCTLQSVCDGSQK